MLTQRGWDCFFLSKVWVAVSCGLCRLAGSPEAEDGEVPIADEEHGHRGDEGHHRSDVHEASSVQQHTIYDAKCQHAAQWI
jgi:hypothetical protein